MIIHKDYLLLDDKIKSYIDTEHLSRYDALFLSQEDFNEKLKDLLKFCILEAYVLAHNENHIPKLLFGETIYYQTYLKSTNRKKKTILLEEVKKYYHPDFTYAKEFDIRKWEIFFENKYADIFDYVIRTAYYLLPDLGYDGLEWFLMGLFIERVEGFNDYGDVLSDLNYYPDRDEYVENRYKYYLSEANECLDGVLKLKKGKRGSTLKDYDIK